MPITELEWEQITESILGGISIVAEYKALGLDVTGQTESNDWLECRAIDREDRDPSAAINTKTGHYKDHGGSGQSLGLFDFAAQYGSFQSWQEARKHYSHKAGIKLPRGRSKDRAAAGDSLAFSSWNDFLAQSWASNKPGVTLQSMKDAGCRLAQWPAKTKEHPVVAIPVFNGTGEEDVSGWVIWQRGGRDLPLYQGKDRPPRAVKMLTVKNSKSGMMGVRGLRELSAAKHVWLVEGPTDLLALTGIMGGAWADGHVAIANSGGSTEHPKPWILELLAGKSVYVVRDTDDAGVAGAKLWSNEAAKYAESCHVTSLPFDQDSKKDLRDYIVQELQQRPAQEVFGSLMEMSTAAARVKPLTDAENVKTDDDPRTAIAESICAALKLDVLGEYEDGSIRLFSIELRKLSKVRDIGRLSYAILLQICGALAREKVHIGKDEVPGVYKFEEVREAIALLAGYRRIHPDSEVGAGCWPGKTFDGEDTESIVLVGAGEAARWNGDQKLRRVLSPRVDGLYLDFGRRDKWYDFEKLEKNLGLASNQQWCDDVVLELHELFAQWRWRNQRVDPGTMSAMVIATWIQTLWKWRPLISLTGPSNSGKTYLFQALETLYGNLAILSSKSTEAGIRQRVRHSGGVILCDEFEADKHREKILELFRTSSRGGKVLRGTAGQSGEHFGLRHIVWVAAIEVGLHNEPDRNRFIEFDLQPPTKEMAGKLTLPPPKKLRALGQKTLAIAIRYAKAAESIATLFREEESRNSDVRVVESYSVPAGILSAVYGLSHEAAVHTLTEMVGSSDREDKISTEEELIADIYGSVVNIGRGESLTVGQILEKQSYRSIHAADLERSGLMVVKRDERDYLFISSRAVRKNLLKGTEWQNRQINKILVRVKGASKHRVQIAGAYPHGVIIPMEVSSI